MQKQTTVPRSIKQRMNAVLKVTKDNLEDAFFNTAELTWFTKDGISDSFYLNQLKCLSPTINEIFYLI